MSNGCFATLPLNFSSPNGAIYSNDKVYNNKKCLRKYREQNYNYRKKRRKRKVCNKKGYRIVEMQLEGRNKSNTKKKPKALIS